MTTAIRNGISIDVGLGLPYESAVAWAIQNNRRNWKRLHLTRTVSGMSTIEDVVHGQFVRLSTARGKTITWTGIDVLAEETRPNGQ
jgi:hypothetical protein